MPDNEYVIALQVLTVKMDTQTELLTKINGYVREHSEQLATHTEWIRTHDGRHKHLEEEQKSLSTKIWGLGGGGTLLGIAATILQIFKR